MSVENFFSTYALDKDLKGRIIKEKLPNMSPVATFAGKLARHSGDGLKEITKKLNDSGTAFRIDQESFQRLSQDDRDKLTINHAGVMFGISIQTLEDCLITGAFDIELWSSLYNNVISGTQFSKMHPKEGQSMETLSKDHLQTMRKLAGKDRTLSIFFENGQDGVVSMPEVLRNMLTKSGILSIIQEHILPSYKPRAQMVIA